MTGSKSIFSASSILSITNPGCGKYRVIVIVPNHINSYNGGKHAIRNTEWSV